MRFINKVETDFFREFACDLRREGGRTEYIRLRLTRFSARGCSAAISSIP